MRRDHQRSSESQQRKAGQRTLLASRRRDRRNGVLETFNGDEMKQILKSKPRTLTANTMHAALLKSLASLRRDLTRSGDHLGAFHNLEQLCLQASIWSCWRDMRLEPVSRAVIEASTDKILVAQGKSPKHRHFINSNGLSAEDLLFVLKESEEVLTYSDQAYDNIVAWIGYVSAALKSLRLEQLLAKKLGRSPKASELAAAARKAANDGFIGLPA